MNIEYFIQGLIIFLCLLLPISFVHSHEVRDSQRAYDWDAWDVIPGEVLIKYSPKKSAGLKAKTITSGISGLTLRQIHEPLEKEFNLKFPGKRFISLLPNTYIGYFEPKNREQVLQALFTDPEVIYFEPNRRRIAAPNWGTATPNDPDFPWQWGMLRIGANQVWPQQPATPNVSPIRVAAMEANGPFDNAHQDLATQVSAVQNDNRADTGHGTMVAGIVAATGDNNLDVVGVTNVELVGLDLGNSDSDFANAVTWAVNNGVQVINMSWGWCGDLVCTPCVYSVSSDTEQDAIISASTNDIVFVASAGNDACDTDANGRRQLPASYRGVIGVSAIDANNNLAGFSNFGPYVDLTGPGVNIISTTLGGGTGWGSGTSYSAPHVSGAASAVLVLRNTFDAESISKLMQLTAEDRGSSGRDDGFGCGVVRVDRAVNAIADHYVQLGGYSGFGTPAEPMGTITQALNSPIVLDNSTLGIVRGSYKEGATQANPFTINRPLTLISVGGPVVIGQGTYYNTQYRTATGSDSVSVASDTWPRRPGLAGFQFYFRGGEDKHIDEVKIILDSTAVTSAFNDKNDDDAYTWSAAGHTLPLGTTYGSVSGFSSGGFAESGSLSGNGVFVLTGFRFDYISDDHHLDEVGIEFFNDASGTRARVFFNDNDDDDDFTYEVHYAVIPQNNVVRQGNISSAIVNNDGSESITGIPPYSVIRGFRLDYTNADHHIDELGVELSPGGVWYNDINNDDGMTWSVEWVQLQ